MFQIVMDVSKNFFLPPFYRPTFIGSTVMFFYLIRIFLEYDKKLNYIIFLYYIIQQVFKDRMILKRIQRSIRLLSFAHHSFGVLLLDDKDVQNIQNDFDVLISDIKQDDFSGVISRKLGKKYLSPLLSNEQEFQKIRYGIIFGRHSRGIISLPTRFQNKKPIWIHYMIDSGSPWNFLTLKTLYSLMEIDKTKQKIELQDIFSLKLNGLMTQVGVSKGHFQEINILGMDYLKERNYFMNGKKKVVSIQFEDNNKQ